MQKTPHRRLFLLTGILLLINPVIIYLLTGKLWASLFVPFVFIILTVYLTESQKLKILSTIWLNFLLVLSFFLHAEVVFTHRFSDFIIEDLYKVNRNYYFNRPYLNETFHDKEFLVKYKTNSQGFRIGAEDDPDVTVEECDWLFIGDSYTQGAQVEYEELFTSKLFDHFPDKIIVNAGISGLGIIDEYYYYIREGGKQKASKVFLQICNFNDFMKVEKRSFGFSDYLMHHSNFVRFVLYDFKYANPAELPLGRWTEPFYPDEQSNKDYNIFYKEHSEKKKRDLANFQLYLEKFAKAVQKNGGELIILQIPTKEQVSFRYLNEVLNDFQINIEKLDMNYPNHWLATQCENLGIEHIDLLGDFLKAEVPLFFDFDEHLNKQGHEQIAATLTSHVQNPTTYYPKEFMSSLNTGDRYPVFTNNGGNLLFQSWRDGNMELFSSDSALQNIERLTWNKIDEIHPWPSPNGKSIVFTEGDQSSNRTRIATMELSGKDRKYITSEANNYGGIPSFNYEGDKVTYAEWHLIDGKYTNPYIVVYDLLTKEKQSVTTDEYESWRPIFSPDDSKLYYIAKDKKNQFDIYEYIFKDHSRRNLTESNYDEWDPAISSDGKKLVYAAKKNKNWDLFLMDLENGHKTQLTNSKGDEWDPTFSPCGQYIYYAATYGLRNGIFRMIL